MDLNPAFLQRFSCRVQDVVEGPFDVIELVGLLKYGQIDADALICREGTDVWFPFRELPEFATAQEIPVEKLAHHLQEREQARGAGQSPPANKPFPWGITILGTSFIALIVASLFSGVGTKSALPLSEVKTAAVISTPWHKTETSHFSIECPVLLEKDAYSNSSQIERYRGEIGAASFGVDTLFVPDLSPEQCTKMILGLKDGTIKKFGQPISDKLFDFDGCRVDEISIVRNPHTSNEVEMRYRFTFKNGYIVTAWVVGKRDAISDAEIDRFTNSLILH